MRVWVFDRPSLFRVVAGALAVLVSVFVWFGTAGIVIERIPAVLPVAGTMKPIYSVGTSERKVALTFDISWGENMPTKVLDVLRNYNLQVTFFLSGPWSRNHPDVVRQIVADGHEVQSHGHKHVNYSGLSTRGVQENLMSAHQILKELTGTEPDLVRPPNGDYNDRTIQAALDIGYRTVIWSVDSHDWMNPGVATIQRRVLERVHPGAIVLLHASDSCKQTDLALPAIIEGLRQQGWELVKLSELLKLEGR